MLLKASIGFEISTFVTAGLLYAIGELLPFIESLCCITGMSH